LQRLFAFLERESIPYCVVGDTADLSAGVTNDVDLVIEPSRLSSLPETLFRFSEQTGVRLVQAIQHERSGFFFVLAGRLEDGKMVVVQLDVCGDYYRDGRLLLPAHELLPDSGQRRRSARNYFIPTPGSEFAYYLIKRVDKLALGRRETEYLSTKYREDPSAARTFLLSFFSSTHAAQIEADCQSGEWRSEGEDWAALRGDLRRHARTTVASRLADVARAWRRLRHPTGLFVAVFGPDGSGKSTVNDGLRTKAAPLFWKTEYGHLRPRLGMGVDVQTAQPVVDPHGMSKRGWVGSVAKLVYYAVDYLVGYVIKIVPARIRATLLVYDRYYYDVLVDPVRYRYGGPMSLARFLARVVPQPDAVLFLDAPSEVVRKRKIEVSAEETERQRQAYLSLSRQVSHGYVVNASQPVEVVIDEAIDVLLEVMGSRMRKRIGVV
jgi:thymidylate kinase